MHAPRSSSAASRTSLLAAAVALFLFVSVAYRAASQAITHDEALTWLWILGREGANPFVEGTANNHVAFTLLAWVPTRLLGASEFALRAPSVLAFGFYLFFGWRLCRTLRRPELPLGVFLFLSLNPYLLDFFTAARGYGVSLAGSLWALYELTRWTEDARTLRLVRAGLGLGLAVSAHLTFAVLAGSVFAAFVPLALLAGRSDGSPWKDVVKRTAALVLPAAVVALAVLGPLLARTDRGDFYGGVPTLAEAASLMILKCLAHGQDPWQLGGDPPFRASVQHDIALFLVAGTWVATCVVVASRSRRAWRTSDRASLPSITTLTFAAIVPMLVLAVWVGPVLGFAFEYPDPRRALWILPVLALASGEWISQLGASRLGRRAAALGTIAIWLVVALFATQWNTSYFADFRYDAGSERIFHVIEADRKERGLESARVGVQYMLYEPSLNFYRDKFESGLRPVNRDFVPDPGRYEYAVLGPELDPERFGDLGELVYHDEVSGAWVARLTGR